MLFCVCVYVCLCLCARSDNEAIAQAITADVLLPSFRMCVVFECGELVEL